MPTTPYNSCWRSSLPSNSQMNCMSKYKQTLLFRLNVGEKKNRSTQQLNTNLEEKRNELLVDSRKKKSTQNLRAKLKALAVQQCRASIVLTAYRHKSVNVNAEKRMAAKRDLHFKIYWTAVAGVSSTFSKSSLIPWRCKIQIDSWMAKEIWNLSHFLPPPIASIFEIVNH